MNLELNVVRFEANDIMTASGHVCFEVTATSQYHQTSVNGPYNRHTHITGVDGLKVGQTIGGYEIAKHNYTNYPYNGEYFVSGNHANELNGKYFELVDGAWVLCDEHNN